MSRNRHSLTSFFGLLILALIVGFARISLAESFSQSAPASPGDTIAVIKTSEGTLKAKIFTSIVPEAARNFTELARQGKYNGTIFHRVIKDFMIQGGDFTRRDGTGGHSSKGPGTTIDDQYDARLSHLRGALAWAKTSAPQSIGSQFYIVHNTSGTPFLNHQPGGGPNQGYSVFGQLYEGFDVLDAIAKKPTGANDRPLNEIVIQSITIQIL